MKKIITIITSLILIFTFVSTSIFANENNWIKHEDGYLYYQMPVLNLATNLTVTVPDDEILEIKDFNFGIYESIVKDGKTATVINLTIVKDGEYFQPVLKFRNTDNTMNGTITGASYVSLDAIDFGIRKLEKITDLPDDKLNNIDELPATVENPNKYNTLGHVKFNIQDNTVLVTITYYGTFMLKFNMDIQTDLSLFDNPTEAYYLNINDTPQIIINNGDNTYLKNILLAENNSEIKASFTPHTIWDLKTNELNVVNKYNAYAYIKQNNTGAVIAYFYTDNFVMDNILKTRLSYTTRNKYKFPNNIIHGNYTDWVTDEVEYENTDFLDYQNRTRNWQDWIPGWSQIRWIYKNIKNYEMPRIEKVDFKNQQSYYNVSLNELNMYYRRHNSDFENIKDNSNYNVFAFALYENKDTLFEEIQFYNTVNPDDPKNFQVIEIMYETGGKIYTTIGDDMDLGTGTGDGSNTPDNPDDKGQNPLTVIIIFGVIGLVIFGAFSTKALSSPDKLLKYLFTIAILAVVIIGIYLLLTSGLILTVLRL